MTSPTLAAIDAHDVVRRYGEHRGLDGLTVSIPIGSIYGLLGPNGSGKSTFLSLIAAAEAPEQGTIRVLGETPSPQGRRHLGIVFQESTLDPQATVAENLDLAGRLFGLSRSDCRDRAQALLTQFGLGERYNDPITRLSGGMRRRVDLVRALLHDPAILLLDEPTTGIDPGERQTLWEALLHWPGEGRTIVLATNDLVEADGVCTHAAFLRDGRVAAEGTPAALKAELLREAVLLDWESPTEAQLLAITEWPGVGSVTAQDNSVQITADDASAIIPRLFGLPGHGIRGVRIHPATLEDAYFHHVGTRPLAGAREVAV